MDYKKHETLIYWFTTANYDLLPESFKKYGMMVIGRICPQNVSLTTHHHLTTVADLTANTMNNPKTDKEKRR